MIQHTLSIADRLRQIGPMQFPQMRNVPGHHQIKNIVLKLETDLTEHKIAIATPAIIALCMKPYVRISKDMINDDAYVPALTLQNIA